MLNSVYRTTFNAPAIVTGWPRHFWLGRVEADEIERGRRERRGSIDHKNRKEKRREIRYGGKETLPNRRCNSSEIQEKDH